MNGESLACGAHEIMYDIVKSLRDNQDQLYGLNTKMQVEIKEQGATILLIKQKQDATDEKVDDLKGNVVELRGDIAELRTMIEKRLPVRKASKMKMAVTALVAIFSAGGSGYLILEKILKVGK